MEAVAANGGRQSVWVVADRAPIRRRMRAALELDGFAVREAETGDALPPSAGLVAIACRLGGSADVAAARATVRRAPDARVVLVASEAGRRQVRAALRAGVEAVLFADQVDTALAPTVRAVQAELLVLPRAQRPAVTAASFSRRERQVLAMVAQGSSNDEIAEKLFLATSTVKSHLTSAFQKLGVSSRNEAVAVLLDPEETVGRLVLEAMPPPALATVEADR
jgi:DNA-binding NarL/FixJ family response regulator